MWKLSVRNFAILVIAGMLASSHTSGQDQDKNSKKGDKKATFRAFRSITSLWIDGELAGSSHLVTDHNIDIRAETGRELGDIDAAKVWIEIYASATPTLTDLPSGDPNATLQTSVDNKRYWVRNGANAQSSSEGTDHTIVVWAYFRKPVSAGTQVETLYQRTQHTFKSVTLAP